MEQLSPLLPKVRAPKSRQKAWPRKQFKKDGTPTVQAIKYYGPNHNRFRNDKIWVMEDFNLNNASQVQQFLLSQGWVPTEWNYKKQEDGSKVRGSPKLTEDSFDSIKGDTGRLVAEYRKITARIYFFTGLLRDVREDGTISPRIGGKAVTHRIRHAGVVNVPRADPDVFFGKQCREVFIARPGHVVVGCDSDGCQIRMLIHEMYARGLGNDDFTQGELYGDKTEGTDTHSRNRDAINSILGHEFISRSQAKSIFYATIFGGGVNRIASVVGCGNEQAREVQNAFYRTLPQLPELKRKLVEEWKEKGYLSAVDGRPLYIRSPHMCLVTLVQGDEAAAMEMSMCYADKLISERKLDAHQLIYYHDEIEYEATYEDAPYVAKCMEAAIEWPSKYLSLKIPLTGSAVIGRNWAEVH